MTSAHPSGPQRAEPGADDASRRRRSRWGLGTPVVVALCGTLFVVSATSSAGTDLRPGRYTSLAALVEREADDYGRLQARAADLDAEVAALTRQVKDARVRREQRRAAALAGPAGLGARSGAGVTVVLSDSPRDVLEQALEDPESNINLLVVHQQDIQAVVNAMWVGGAEAMTIQGQRVITTTGIKCEGNAVQLQGVPYPQPYVISAVGDPTRLLGALESDQDVTDFRADAASPDVSVGWDVAVEDDIEAPAYDGLLDVTEAEPLR